LKRFLLPLATAILTATLGHASVVINCSGDKDAVNSCMASKLPNFTTHLDWATSLNTAVNGDVYHNAVWTVNNVLTGMNISVGDQDTSATEGLVRAYNLGSVFYQGQWTLESSLPYSEQVFSFAGHFDAPPSTTPGSAVAPGNPGDALVGLALNGASANRSLLLSFGAAGFDNIGFRVASTNNSTFELRVQVFANTAGTGTALTDFVYTYGAGGQCENLFITVHPGAPLPCNDAPFIGLLNYEGGAHSIRVSTNDTLGFYIGNLYAGDFAEAPEPGTIILCGCGIAAVAIARRRQRRAS
jgi:hypothetical protein